MYRSSTPTSRIDRTAPLVFSLIVVALVLAGLLYGVHQLAAAADKLTMALGGVL